MKQISQKPGLVLPGAARKIYWSRDVDPHCAAAGEVPRWGVHEDAEEALNITWEEHIFLYCVGVLLKGPFHNSLYFL